MERAPRGARGVLSVQRAIVFIVAGLCWIAPAQAQSSVLDSPRIRLSAHVAQIMHDVAGF